MAHMMPERNAGSMTRGYILSVVGGRAVNHHEYRRCEEYARKVGGRRSRLHGSRLIAGRVNNVKHRIEQCRRTHPKRARR